MIGVPSERWGEEVKALVVLKQGADADAATLMAHSRQFLAGFKTPKSIEFVPSLIRSGAGKILRRVMREPYWVGRDRVEPATFRGAIGCRFTRPVFEVGLSHT